MKPSRVYHMTCPSGHSKVNIEECHEAIKRTRSNMSFKEEMRRHNQDKGKSVTDMLVEGSGRTPSFNLERRVHKKYGSYPNLVSIGHRVDATTPYICLSTSCLHSPIWIYLIIYYTRMWLVVNFPYRSYMLSKPLKVFEWNCINFPHTETRHLEFLDQYSLISLIIVNIHNWRSGNNKCF